MSLRNRTPTVTVLMPVLNGAKYLREALSSILTQTWEDFELLVIDDGSTDATPSILAQVKDSRLRVVYHDGSCGVAACLNQGLDLAKGEFVVRMDADDISEKGRLAQQLSHMRRHPELALVGSALRCILPKASFVYAYPCSAASVRAGILFDNPLAHPTVCIRRQLFLEGGWRYDERLGAAQDYELWSRAADSLSMANLRAPLVRYRVHSSSVSSTRSRISDEQSLRIQRGWLRRLGVDPSEDALRFHRRVGHGAGCRSLSELREASEWLKYLLAQNNRNNLFAPAAMKEVVAQAWLRVCLNSSFLGSGVLRCYVSTPLFRGYADRSREALVLWLSVARAMAGLGPKGPTGEINSWKYASEGINSPDKQIGDSGPFAV